VGYDPWGLSYKAFNLPSHPDHKCIWYFSETTKDRNLIFDMGEDANVKLSIQHFYPRGSAPSRWEICFKKCDRDPHPKPYIFMIRVTRQIKCIIAQAPGSFPTPYMK
jgi:hypothetical protein